MTLEYRTLLKALKTALPGWTVLPDSYVAAVKDWPLPAVILDLENPSLDSILEDNTIEETMDRFSLTFQAELSLDDPTKPMQKIEDGFKAAIPAIGAAFPRKVLNIDLPVYGYLPFGKTQIAPGLAFFLRISDGE